MKPAFHDKIPDTFALLSFFPNLEKLTNELEEVDQAVEREDFADEFYKT